MSILPFFRLQLLDLIDISFLVWPSDDVILYRSVNSSLECIVKAVEPHQYSASYTVL